MLRAVLRTSVVCLPSQNWIITPQVHEPQAAPRNNPIGFDDPGSSASGSNENPKNPVYSAAINTNLKKDGNGDLALVRMGYSISIGVHGSRDQVREGQEANPCVRWFEQLLHNFGLRLGIIDSVHTRC